MPPSPTPAATSAVVPFPIVEEEEVEMKTLPFSSDILKCGKLKYDGSNYDVWVHSIDSVLSLQNLEHQILNQHPSKLEHLLKTQRHISENTRHGEGRIKTLMYRSVSA